MSDLLLWGRANSVNVEKVLWGLAELDLPFERRDAGMAFGVVDTPAYRALNPNGRVPTLVDGEVVLWESNAILRYLAMREASRPVAAALYPAGAAARASVDRWLDWVLSTMAPADRPMFWGLVRTAPADRDEAGIAAAARATGLLWGIVEVRLGDGRPFVEGEAFTLADLVLGTYARRWFLMPVPGRPELPRLAAWNARLAARPAYRAHLDKALS